MPEILEDTDNTVVLLQNLSYINVPTGLRYYYISPEDADAYFETSISGFNNSSWVNSERSIKQRALAAATKLIDRLNFDGDKADDEQEYEFPREIDSVVQETIPLSIQYACAEIAKSIVDGIDIEIETNNLNKQSYGLSQAKTVTFNDQFVPEHLRAGIPSAIAWNYLRPYLANTKTMKLYKV